MKITAFILAATLAATSLFGCDKAKNDDISTGGTETKINKETETKEETEDKAMEAQIFTNTYHKLTNDKELTIAYIGGSVTDGYGSTDASSKSWASLLGKHINENYPEVKLNNRKLSIGGTGSYLASFRYEKEIASVKPDLLFIEYAINDKYNGASYEQVVRSSESIVRLANKFNPAIDIVYVLTFDSGTKDTDYDQLRAHRDVAQYYGYPCIKMADKVYAMLSETGDEYSVYFKDGVHPNDAGYAFYAEQIIALFEEEMAKANEADSKEYKEHTLPKVTLSEYVTLNANMIYADEIDLSNSQGWEYQSGSNYSWLGRRYNGRVFAKELGAKFTFEFEGTELGLATGIGPNMGIISVTVDDREPVVIDEYRTSTNPKDRVIAEGLEEGIHTVTIEVTGKNEKSGGYEFEIGAVLVG